jgi:hypothetical protein
MTNNQQSGHQANLGAYGRGSDEWAAVQREAALRRAPVLHSDEAGVRRAGAGQP